MAEEKGFAFLAPLVLIIVLGILGISAYLTYQKANEFSGQQNKAAPVQKATENQTPQVATKLTIDQIKEWQTYTSDKYGFKIDYPKDWNTDDTEPFYVYISPEKKGALAGENMAFLNESLGIGVVSVKSGTFLSNFIDSYLNVSSSSSAKVDIKINKQNTKIAEIDGFKVTTECQAVGCGNPNWFVMKDNKVYIFSSHLSENIDIFEKMISTFQFSASTPQIQSLEQKCIQSGGKVNQITCYCSSTKDFYNSCLIGGCTCTPNPASARQIKTCDCGANKCFDGNACVTLND